MTESHASEAATRQSLPALLRVTLQTSVNRLMTEHGRVDRVRAGRLLLIVQGVFIDGSAPLLHPDRKGWLALAWVAVAMTLLVIVSFALPRRVNPFRTGLVSPTSTMIALAVLGLADPGTFAPLIGYLSLSFVFLGVTQRARVAVLMLPLADATLVIAYGQLNGDVATRLAVSSTVWVTTAALLAMLASRVRSSTLHLTRAARVDLLTGVPNRRDLSDRLSHARPGQTLVVCDLDHFKRINDTAGHAAGDQVLSDFGALLRAELREGDYCARYGGEEFVLILSGAARGGHRSVIERLHRSWALMQPRCTFSTGVAVCNAQRLPEETLALADRALYAAKHGGRNTDRFAEDLEADASVVTPIAALGQAS